MNARMIPVGKHTVADMNTYVLELEETEALILIDALTAHAERIQANMNICKPVVRAAWGLEDLSFLAQTLGQAGNMLQGLHEIMQEGGML